MKKIAMILCASFFSASAFANLYLTPVDADVNRYLQEDNYQTSVRRVPVSNAAVFKLYPRPKSEPNPGCDVHTKLVLDVNGDVGTATLSNHVSGFCEIAVFENKRTYKVQLDSTQCGTEIYAEADDEQKQILVTDNRARVCDNVLPALIVVTEFDENGDEMKLYSQK